jgi:hypothetical protein
MSAVTVARRAAGLAVLLARLLTLGRCRDGNPVTAPTATEYAD